jgi:ribosomal-protein-alanine N-acetyltransferase
VGAARRLLGRARLRRRTFSDVDKPPLHFDTERLRLFVPGPDDAERMLDYALRNRAHLRRWEPTRGHDYWTLPYWQRQLEAVREEVRRGDGYRTALVPRDDLGGAVIGVANLSQIVRGPSQSAILGYSLDAEHEGLGLMREGLAGLVEFAFDVLGLHRLQACYRPENVRSARVLEALAFEREGLARAYLFIEGAWRDHVLAARLNPDARAPQ